MAVDRLPAVILSISQIFFFRDLVVLMSLNKFDRRRISTASCFSLVYRFYDGRLATLCRPLVDAASDEIETSELSDGTVQAISADQAVDGDPKMKTGTSLFELYVGLQQFHKCVRTR